MVVYAKAFDLWYLLVENVFGSITLSILGLLATFTFICMISRISKLSMVLILSLFALSMLMVFFGGIAVFLFGLVALAWAFFGAWRWWSAVKG